MNKPLFLDTETTGLNPHYGDELVEIAIVDSEGNTLLNTFVKPTQNAYWNEAQKIHGITPAMVENAPTFEELKATITQICKGKTVVIYNASFDLSFLDDCLVDSQVECCMERFAEFYGEWNDYFENYKWQNLSIASAYVGYKFEGKAHRALADTLACRSVWNYLNNPLHIETRKLELEEKERIKEESYIEECAERIHFLIKWDREKKKEDFRLEKSITKEFFQPKYFWECWNEYFDNWKDYQENYEDTINFLFTGERLVVKEIKAKYPTVPTTNKKGNLVTEHYLRKKYNSIQIDSRFFDTPKKIYVSSTQKTIHLLYCEKEFDNKHKKAGLELKAGRTRPKGIFTLTELKKLKVDLSEYENVGFQNDYYGGSFHLYEKKK